MCFRQHLLIAIAVFSIGCSQPTDTDPACAVAEAFFEHYKDRNDWTGFLERYHPDTKFVDIILQMELNGVDAFAEFYNWPDPLFRKHPDFPETLEVESLLCVGTTAVAHGYFKPFYYRDVFYADTAHMRFTMWLEFDSSGLITRHTDFIEYPPDILRAVADRLMSTSDTTNLQ